VYPVLLRSHQSLCLSFLLSEEDINAHLKDTLPQRMNCLDQSLIGELPELDEKMIRTLQQLKALHREKALFFSGVDKDISQLSDQIGSFQLQLASHQLSSAAMQKANMRERFPRAASNTLRRWLLDHQDAPYPDEAEKHALLEETGLTRKQIDVW
jgi:Homeobox KN domain